MTQLPLQAAFNGQSLDIITIFNQRWLMGAQVAHSLGYANPKQAIKDIIARNKAEFGLDDMMVIELPDAMGRMQLTRIFSDKGCAKLGFKAKTPKAAAFRNWAAKTLTTPPAPQSPPVLELTAGLSPYVARDLATFWMKHKPNRLFVKYAHLPIARIDMARMCGWKTASTVTSKRRVAEALGLIAPDKSLMPSPFARHVALQRAASASLALSSHAG